eukprot:4642699-Prymnesium_polylepis.1
MPHAHAHRRTRAATPARDRPPDPPARRRPVVADSPVQLRTCWPTTLVPRSARWGGLVSRLGWV